MPLGNLQERALVAGLIKEVRSSCKEPAIFMGNMFVPSCKATCMFLTGSGPRLFLLWVGVVLTIPVPIPICYWINLSQSAGFFLQFVMCRLNVVLDRLGPVTCEPSQNLVANRTGLSVHTDQLTLRPAVLQVQTSHRIETAWAVWLVRLVRSKSLSGPISDLDLNKPLMYEALSIRRSLII